MTSRTDRSEPVEADSGAGENGKARVDSIPTHGNGGGKRSLEIIYELVARQHDNIDDFRAKLLAALPVVTGVGLFALLQHAHAPGASSNEFFAAIGIFGALASLGLFVHELRGISECYMLIELGRVLEDKLGCGPFTARRSVGFRGLVGRETAALVIYPVTIAGWSFLAAVGLPKLPDLPNTSPMTTIVLMVSMLAIVLAGIGWALLLREYRKVEVYIARLQ